MNVESSKGVYGVIERELKRLGIGYVGVDGVQAKKRNHLARKFEADPTATVLLAGTGTLNRGVTINGANHVIILNTEWSPETTLQAEDRCHRPGQTKPVTVHYILSMNTVDEQMWDIINQKHDAQRAVFDKVPQDKSVEEIMAEATSAQIAVAQALVSVKRQPSQSEGPIVTADVIPTIAAIEQAAKPIETKMPADQTNTAPTAKQLNLLDLFERHGAQGKRPAKQIVVPEQQLSLFDLASA